MNDFAYLYFSAGFGGGVVAAGRPLRGNHGNAGEFASILPIDWPQPNIETLRNSFVDAGSEFQDIQAMLDGFDPHHPGWTP